MPSLQKISEEVKAGRVREFKHLNFQDLSGFNYTELCQFSREWNDDNILCRGIIFDKEKCIARPFSKFFNIEEVKDDLSNKTIKFIQNKEDGSLIITYYYNDKVRFATRGSFHSDQAKIADRIWLERYANRLDNSLFLYWTLLFELVGPSNVNVSRGYKTDELILLSATSIETGEEAPESFIDEVAERLGCLRPKLFYANSVNDLYEKIKENEDPNFEGVVVTFLDGLKIKIKSNLYVNLHKVLTGTFSRDTKLQLWEEMRSTSKISIFDQLKIPDEFFQEIKIEVDKIETLFSSVCQEYSAIHLEMLSDFKKEMPRKDMALKWVNHRWMLSPIFSNDLDMERHYLRLFKKDYLDGKYD